MKRIRYYFSFLLVNLIILITAVQVQAQNFKGGINDGHAASSVTNADLNTVPEYFYPIITLADGQAELTNVSTVHFKVSFNRSTFNFFNSGVTIGGTANASTIVVSGGPLVFNVAVGGMLNDGTINITIQPGVCTEDQFSASNAASVNQQNEITYETQKPVPTINLAFGQSDPAGVTPVHFQVNFSEAVLGFESADLVLSGTALATTAVVTGSGAVYQVDVSGMSQEGTVTMTIPEGVCSDLAGNTNTPSQNTYNSVSFIVNGPDVTINQGLLQADPVNYLPIIFEVEFSREVLEFTFEDMVWTGSADGISGSVSGDGQAFTVSVHSVSTDGTLIASIPMGQVTDLFGLGNKASASIDNSVTLDRINPEVQISLDPSQQDPTNSEIVSFSADFSETVLSFTADDVELTGSSGATTVYLRGGPQFYTIDITGMTVSGMVTVTVPAGVLTDEAGNLNNPSQNGSNSVFYDNQKPDVQITSSVLSPTNASEILIRIEFSEEVFDFAISDINVSNGTTTYLYEISSNRIWETHVFPMGVGLVDVQIPENAATDVAGNGNNASNHFQISYSGPEIMVFEATNIFTPNSAQNRFWIIRNIEKYTDYELTIRNAAGQLVYQTKNYQNDWNGTYQNKSLPTGTYYYFFSSPSGDKVFKGFINLIYE